MAPNLLIDVGTASFIEPLLSECGLSDMTPVTVSVANYGTDPAVNVDMTLKVDGLTVATEVMAGPIPVGGSLDYTFTATANLSALGVYLLDVIATTFDDANISNDTASITIENYGAFSGPLPIYDNFDGYTDGTTSFVEFDNDASGDVDWQVNYGPTTSSNTGPINDVTGSGAYLYMETSSPVASGDRAILRSKCIDLTSALNPRLEFYYHMYGASIKSLDVLVAVGGVPTNVFSLSGQQQTANADPWLSALVDLTPFVGDVIVLYFIAEANDDGNGNVFYGDTAIDEITIKDPLPNDIGVVAINTPNGENCAYSDMEPITITIENFGSTDEFGFDVGYVVNGPTGTSTITETYAGTLVSGTSDSYTFTALADMSLLGNYTITAATLLGGDSNIVNDTTVAMITSGGSILPISDNFDTYADATIVFPDFTNNPDDELEWEVNFGGTTSTATGPDDDVSGGGGYIYLETSGTSAGFSGEICTGCLNLTNSLAPRLEFSYHMYGASIDSLVVSVDNGTTVTNVLALIGEQQTTNTDAWLPAVVDLSAFAGQVVEVCFTGNIKSDPGGNTFNGDIALDEIYFLDPLPMDVGVDALLDPNEACSLGNAESITISIQNTGSTTETGFDVTYEVNGPTGTFMVTENIDTLSIAPGASVPYTFNVPLDMSLFGSYDFIIYTSLGGDPQPLNDTLNISVLTGGAPIPILDDFNTYADGETVLNSLINDQDDQLDWEVNYGPTTSTATGPNDDVSGGGGYLYIETSGSSDGDRAIACTDCINLTGGMTPQLEFNYHMYGGSIDSLAVTIDDGTTVTELIVLVGEQQFDNADPWQKAVIDLTAYVGSVVSICFEGSVMPDAGNNLFNGDIAIDNLYIREPPPCPEPYNLVATNITDATTEIAWTGGGNGIAGILEYGPTGFAPGTGIVIDPATNPQLISGLAPQTTYQVYLTEDCDTSGLSLQIGPIAFTTQCSPFPFPGNFITNPIMATALPYTDASSTSNCYTDDFTEISASPDVYYSFMTGACAGTATVSLCGSAYDTRLSILDPSDGTLLYTNDDNCGLQSEITFPVSGAQSFLAVIEGFGATSAGSYTLNITETLSTGIDQVNATGTNPICPDVADGTIEIDVVGGAQPFNYIWSNGATIEDLPGVPEGVYTVTVTDNCGGLATSTYTLVDPPKMLTNAGAGGTICFGDSIGIGGAPTVTLGNPFNFFIENAFGHDVLNSVFFKHDLDTPDNVTDISTSLVGDYFAGDFGPDGFYTLENTLAALIKIDTAVGASITTVGPANQLTGHTWTGLAWDGTTFHGLSTDGASSQLYTIDYTTGAATPTVIVNSPTLIWLAIDNNGNAYSMDIGTDLLYAVDLATGTLTTIGNVGFDAAFAQDADFDPISNKLYLSAYNNSTNQGELRVADLNTGNTTLIGAFPNGGEIAAFGIADLPTPLMYDYEWIPSSGVSDPFIPNPTVSPSLTTNYIVQVTDACGNTSTSNALVNVNQLPLADAGPDVSLCAEPFVALIASGGLFYSWDSGETGASIIVTPPETTTYTVTVTDTNCSALDSVTVIVTEPIVPTITLQADSVTLESSPADSYQWYFDNMIIPGATDQTYVVDMAGVYSVVTVDSVDCEEESDYIFITDFATSINTLEEIDKFLAYPNPTSAMLMVQVTTFRQTSLRLDLLDLLGRTVHSEQLEINQEFSTSLDMENLPGGVYFLRLSGETGSLLQRIVKQ